jgi:hypothetical protein
MVLMEYGKLYGLSGMDMNSSLFILVCEYLVGNRTSNVLREEEGEG